MRHTVAEQQVAHIKALFADITSNVPPRPVGLSAPAEEYISGINLDEEPTVVDNTAILAIPRSRHIIAFMEWS